MNYNDYRQEMDARNLTESVESLQYLIDAAKCTENIKVIKGEPSQEYIQMCKRLRFFPDDEELIASQKKKRDRHIQKAIAEGIDKPWADKTFGRSYYINLKIIASAMEPTELSIVRHPY